MTNYVTLVGGMVLSNVHSPSLCKGNTCSIHNVSDHHMVGWKQLYRWDSGVMERICEHGVGHPDPDDFPYWKSTGDLSWVGIHGCDGCCQDK